MSREVEARIAAVARRQHGVVTRAQLMEAGLSSWALERRAREGLLQRLYRGVYLVGPIPLDGHREMAAVLAIGHQAHVSHFSASRIWGLEGGVVRGAKRGGKIEERRSSGRGPPNSRMPRTTAGSLPDLVHVSVVGVGAGSRRGIRVHRVRRLGPDERTTRNGIPVTSPGRTLLDLAGVVGSRELGQAVAVAEREGLIDRDGLLALSKRHPRRRGMPMLRFVLATPGGVALTRSEAEERFLALVTEAGLPPPETNAPIGWYEIDFFWRREKVAVEVDGFAYHSSPGRFEGDRKKDAWLMARGITVARVSRRQVIENGMATVVHVARILDRAER